MQKILLLILILPSFSNWTFSQEFYQYFDGADTLSTSIIVEIDTVNPDNIWQVGLPQKTIFNSAFSFPNVIMTDTINYYPINDSSNFTFRIEDLTEFTFGGILALQWTQKLDLDTNYDGAFVEFSTDAGTTWNNAFNNSFVYNFYGFDDSNKDTLVDGSVAFSGFSDSWNDIWLCFDISWLSLSDTVMFKFTLKSDTIDNNREGWMIDNIVVHPTWFHTINENEQEDYLIAYPNPTNSGIINIQARKSTEFHIIEKMELTDINGKLIREYGISPTKFQIDISDLPKGVYLLRVRTNIDEKVFKIIYD